MNGSVDYLSQRVMMWQAAPHGTQTEADPMFALQGWALARLFERSAAPPPADFEQTSHSLPPPDPSQIPALLSHARERWENFLNELDREEENFESVREVCADVFFTLLEAFTCAEGLGSDEDRAAARGLFNQVISQAGLFEPMAEMARQLAQPHGAMQLSGLLCAGVVALTQDEEIEEAEEPQLQEREAESFVAIGTLVRKIGRTKALSLEALAQFVARSRWWYIKWCAQRVRLEVVVKSAQLRLEVYEGEGRQGREAVSKALDGWSVRVTGGAAPGSCVIANGMATMKLGPTIDPAKFSLQIKEASGREWQELFGRVGG